MHATGSGMKARWNTVKAPTSILPAGKMFGCLSTRRRRNFGFAAGFRQKRRTLEVDLRRSAAATVADGFRRARGHGRPIDRHVAGGDPRRIFICGALRLRHKSAASEQPD